MLVQASAMAKRILPLFDRVLVERFAAATTTKGGIHIPEKAMGKVLNATVLAVGKGLKQKVRWTDSRHESINQSLTESLLGRNSCSSQCSSW